MSIREQIESYLALDKYWRCNCDLCKRGRKFMSIVNKLTDDSDVQWMSDFYDYVINHEESTSMEIEYLEYKIEHKTNYQGE
jgi:hypothetical protein